MTKNFLIISLISTFFYCSILAPSCTSDKLEPVEPAEFCDTLNVTYDLQVREIISTSCAYVGCHIGGFSSGDFTTYEGMLPLLDAGEIERRTITLLDMPPPSNEPLSPENLEILSCWLSKGHPKQ